MRHRCRRSASHHIAVQELVSAMRNESSGKYTPRPPLCPSCAQIMRLGRIPRSGDLPDVYIFECQACGVSHIDAVEVEAAKTAGWAEKRFRMCIRFKRISGKFGCSEEASRM